MKECKMIRFFDLLISITSLIFLLPFVLLITIILRFTGEGEIFYKQKRIGKNKKIFYLLKFATMNKNSPQIGSKTITIKNDPRVLPFGKILRKTKVNELPQLINIILGDMSLIGPRPLSEEVFSLYSVNVQKKISSERPGLSGIGSIVFRNEEELLENKKNTKKIYQDKIIPYKGQLELWYTENKSLYTYFLLLILTGTVLVIPLSIRKIQSFLKIPDPPKNLLN